MDVWGSVSRRAAKAAAATGIMVALIALGLSAVVTLLRAGPASQWFEAAVGGPTQANAVAAGAAGDMPTRDRGATGSIDPARPSASRPVRRAASDKVRTAPGVEPLKVLNPGTVEDRIAIADLAEPAAAESLPTTPDDDLDPAGTMQDWYPSGRTTYRTVCVRLCDGALTPISFATTKDRFALDALRCRKSCNGPTRLYVQKNPATDADGFVDLDGRRYTALDTAFKFRTSYDTGCTCRPHAWDVVARARHRMLAIVDRVRIARDVVHGRVAELKYSGDRGVRLAARSRPDLERAPKREQAAAEQDSDAPLPRAAVGRQAAVAGDVTAAALTASGKPSRKARIKDAKAAAKGRTATRVDASGGVIVKAGGGPAVQRVRLGSLADAGAGRRRYDGTDWRISLFEPL
jgi:hypothetical protein